MARGVELHRGADSRREALVEAAAEVTDAGTAGAQRIEEGCDVIADR
jgi:hypothetical protein